MLQRRVKGASAADLVSAVRKCGFASESGSGVNVNPKSNIEVLLLILLPASEMRFVRAAHGDHGGQQSRYPFRCPL